VNFPFLEWRISVHARDALATLEATVAHRLLMTAGDFRNPARIACCFLLLETRSTDTSYIHALSVWRQRRELFSKMYIPAVFGESGVESDRIGTQTRSEF
jgi:hypothetical protein